MPLNLHFTPLLSLGPSPALFVYLFLLAHFLPKQTHKQIVESLHQSPKMSPWRPSADNAFGPAIGANCRSTFDFTLLFEQTILTIAPASILLLLAPPRIWHLLRSSTKTLPNPIGSIKALFAVALIALQLAILALWTPRSGTKASIPSSALSLIASLAILLLSTLEHTRSIRPSFLLTIYLLSSLTFDIAQARTLFLRNHDSFPSNPNPTIPGIFVASIAVKLVLLALEARSKRAYLQQPYKTFPPEATSGVLNRSVFWWLNPLFVGGWRKILGLEDLYGIDRDLMAEGLLERMEGAWEKCKSTVVPYAWLTSPFRKRTPRNDGVYGVLST